MMSNTGKTETLIKRCKICNAKALKMCFNFQILSCSPCRLFFYRNFAKFEKLKCKKNELCKINTAQSKHCKKCRLKKCLEAGMDLNLTIKKKNKKNILKSKSCLISLLLQPADNQSTAMDERKTDYINLKLEKDKLLVNLSPKVNPAELKLAIHERAIIARAGSLIKEIFPDERLLPVTGVVKHPAEPSTMAIRYVPKLIQLANSFPLFEQLSKPEKLSILKSLAFEFMAIRVSFIYDAATQTIPFCSNDSFTEVYMFDFNIFNDHNMSEFIQQNHQLKAQLNVEMENDSTIRDLLLMQHIFKPRDGLEVLETFFYQHTTYCYLLRRHLEEKYGEQKAALRKYDKLQALIEQLKEGRARHVKFLESILSLDTKLVPELTAELFNLNVH